MQTHAQRGGLVVVACVRWCANRSTETAQARATGPRRLKQSSVAKRKEPVIAKDHVVQHANAEHVTRFFESPRYLLVFLAGRRIAARMIVNKNDRSRTQIERRSPYLTWMN
jgi:hypothetical protein